MAIPQLPDTEQVLQEIAALMPDWPLAAIESIAHLGGGFSNHNFRFRCDKAVYVIRVPGRTRPYVDRQAEFELLRSGHLCSDPALEAPSLIAADPATGAMITRWVDGQLLTEAPTGEEDLIDYLKRLHATLPPTSRTYDPLELSRQLLAGARGPRWLTRLLASLTWQPQKLVATHNDLNPWNVIRTATGTWLTLDWEWFGNNDPLFDLVTLQQGLGLPAQRLHPMAERLLDIRVTEARIERCLRLFWLREYAWAHAELAAGQDQEAIRAQLSLSADRLRQLN